MDDLLARMNAAATQAISAAQKEQPAAETAATEPATEAAEAPAQEEAAQLDGADDSGSAPAEGGVDDAGEATEASAETPAEASAAETKDIADEILSVRKAANRRVLAAEKRVAALEAELKQLRASPNTSSDEARKQIVEDVFNKLRRSPARFFEEHGHKFQDFIDAAIREGESRNSPLGAEFDELRDEMRALRAEREEMRKQRELEERKVNEGRAKNQFLSMVKKTEFPTLFAMFQGSEDRLYAEAVQVAEAHQHQHGEAPSAHAIIKYLESQYAERIKRATGSSSAAPAAEAKKPTAPKTLTTKAVSESRGAGKPFGQLGRDEQRDALLKAVAQASSRTAN